MREQWNSKLGFLLAAIGSAVGLGNIWRFPYIAATNGGGAFLLPYFFAIITAGIPILILEYTMGKTYRAGAPVTWARMKKKYEFLGWVQATIAFVITTYYFSVVVWVTSYIGFSFNQAWGDDTAGFFIGEYLGVTGSQFELGGIQTGLIFPFLLVWALTMVVLYSGVKKGIETVCKFGMPVLFILMVILAIRGVTLEGAADGLNYLFSPNWEALKDPQVWVAAYGQIFFSLSIAFAIMIAYSSYLPKKTDVVNSAFITATANHGFELLAGTAVFSIMGYMAMQQGVSVEEVAGGGVGLAFITFPQAISALPALNSVFGVAFFGALFIAGVTSLISILQAVKASVQDKFNLSHNKAVTLVVVPTFLLSGLFITGAGLLILDVVDAFINSIGIVGSGLVEVILVAWFFGPEKIREYANEYSNFTVGKWWNLCLRFVTVIVLGVMIVLNTKDYIVQGYEGYTTAALGVFGWGSIGFVLVVALVLTLLKGKKGYDEMPKDVDKEEE